ncbi:hypothetical protein BD414DRAFT_486621, partial [Trametes punicea]
MNPDHDRIVGAGRRIGGASDVQVETFKLGLLERLVRDAVLCEVEKLLLDAFEFWLGAYWPKARAVCLRGIVRAELRLAEAGGNGRVFDTTVLVHGRVGGGNGVHDAREGCFEVLVEDDWLLHVVESLCNHGWRLAERLSLQERRRMCGCGVGGRRRRRGWRRGRGKEEWGRGHGEVGWICTERDERMRWAYERPNWARRRRKREGCARSGNWPLARHSLALSAHSPGNRRHAPSTAHNKPVARRTHSNSPSPTPRTAQPPASDYPTSPGVGATGATKTPLCQLLRAPGPAIEHACSRSGNRWIDSGSPAHHSR